MRAVPVGDDAPPMTEEQFFKRFCYLNGITDEAAVARLWAEREGKK